MCRLTPRLFGAAPNANHWGIPNNSAALSKVATPGVGKTSHTQDHYDSKTLSCINCSGRPETLVRQRANILRSRTYIPFTVATQRARDNLKSPDQGSDQPVSKTVDDCWSRARVGVAASSTVGTPPLPRCLTPVWQRDVPIEGVVAVGG